jgi:hypothetical protein
MTRNTPEATLTFGAVPAIAAGVSVSAPEADDALLAVAAI